jgi:hypothetical protein
MFSTMENKTCTTCQLTKPLADFYLRQKEPPLYKSRCKACHDARQKAYAETERGKEVRRKAYARWRGDNIEQARQLSRESNRAAREKDPRRFKGYELKARYSMSLEEYEALLERQNHACAICGVLEPGGMGVFHVDHCHKSSRVRGLLCNGCNIGLGKFKDNEQYLLAAVKYLSQT